MRGGRDGGADAACPQSRINPPFQTVRPQCGCATMPNGRCAAPITVFICNAKNLLQTFPSPSFFERRFARRPWRTLNLGIVSFASRSLRFGVAPLPLRLASRRRRVGFASRSLRFRFASLPLRLASPRHRLRIASRSLRFDFASCLHRLRVASPLRRLRVTYASVRLRFASASARFASPSSRIGVAFASLWFGVAPASTRFASA